MTRPFSRVCSLPRRVNTPHIKATPNRRRFIRLSNIRKSVRRIIRRKATHTRVIRQNLRSVTLRKKGRTLRPIMLQSRHDLNRFSLRRPNTSIILFRGFSMLLNKNVLPNRRHQNVRHGKRRPIPNLYVTLRRLNCLLRSMRVRLRSITYKFRGKGRLIKKSRNTIQLSPTNRHLDSSSQRVLKQRLKLRMRLRLAILGHLQRTTRRLANRNLLSLRLFIGLSDERTNITICLLTNGIYLISNNEYARTTKLGNMRARPRPRTRLQMVLNLVLLGPTTRIVPQLASFATEYLLE